MAYEFMSLAEVEALPEVPENATVLAEVDGSIKRIPGEGLGGSGNNLVIVESSFTDFYSNSNAPTRKAARASAPAYTYTANMEFADALAAFRACELTNTILYAVSDGGPTFFNCAVADLGAAMSVSATGTSEPVQTIDCLVIAAELAGDKYTTLFWTADGISSKMPGGVEQ